MQALSTLKSITTSLGHPSVDLASGILTGVVLIAEGEIKYDRGFADHTTLKTVKASAERFGDDGLPIVFNPDTFDHGTASIAGSLKSLRIDGQRLIGDLHVLKFLKSRDYLLELAASQPNTFGLSVDMWPSFEEIGGKTFWRCDEIEKATVVITPAATPGLFSGRRETRQVDAAKRKSQSSLVIAACRPKPLKASLFSRCHPNNSNRP